MYSIIDLNININRTGFDNTESCFAVSESCHCHVAYYIIELRFHFWKPDNSAPNIDGKLRIQKEISDEARFSFGYQTL